MYLYYFFFGLFVLLIIASALLSMLVVESVNQKLPEEKRLSGWTRWSATQAFKLYKDFYPNSQLTTAFYICLLAEFIVFVGMILTRLR